MMCASRAATIALGVRASFIWGCGFRATLRPRCGDEGAASSDAAKAAEEGGVTGEDPLDIRLLRLGDLDTALERAAAENAVGAGKHIAHRSSHGVADLGLGEQNRELAAYRDHAGIAKQG